MIAEFFLNIIFALVEGMFSILPDISWDVGTGVFSSFLDVLSCVCYMLPMGTVSVIAGLTLSISVFRAVIALVKTIWDLLPIV